MFSIQNTRFNEAAVGSIQAAEGPNVLDFQPLIFLVSFTRSLEGLAIFRADTSAKKHKNVKSETPDLMPKFCVPFQQPAPTT
jgi:hypothetical protein